MKRIKIIFAIVIGSVIATLFCVLDFKADANSNENLVVLVEGLESNGDCTIIRYGDIQILIDAAESKEAYSQIIVDMQETMSGDDGMVWDYVIFTHPDSDHIGNAVRVIDYIYNSGWQIGTIIDYGESDKDTVTAQSYENKVDAVYEMYDLNYFDASSLNISTLTKQFTLSDTCRLLILYNETNSKSTWNDLSVCCLIEVGDQKLLFTGDLEESGEKNLIKNHKDIIEGVTFFKAAHHGSSSSNTEDFIDVIRPAYVAITLEKEARGQDFSFNNFLKYTDYIFPTYVEYLGSYYKMYGSERYSFDGKKVAISTEGNPTLEGDERNLRNATISFAGIDDYNWYEAQLKESADLANEIMVYTFDEGLSSYSNCSLVKYGHYDILIDCGSTVTDSMAFVKKLKQYVVDGTIEYVVVSHYHVANISQLIGNYKNRKPQNDGVFGQFEIGTIIDGELTNFVDASESGFYKKYISDVSWRRNRKTLGAYECYEYNIVPGELSLKVIGNSGNYSVDENDYSLATLLTFGTQRLLFAGDMVDYSLLTETYASEIKNLSFLRLSNATSSNYNSYNEFSAIAKPNYCVIGSALGYVMPNGKEFIDRKTQDSILRLFKTTNQSNIYFSGYVNERNEYIPVNGDLYFRMGYRGGKIFYKMDSEMRRDPVMLEDDF